MTREPIAIVGMGCRLPGNVMDPASYWDLLREGRDAIVEVPEDRWTIASYYEPEPRPGKTYACRGGFIQGVDQFDPGFFGISRREASSMDPQQRLLLEVAWEALEDGGQIADELSGSDVGVFVGISSTEYASLQWGDSKMVNAHSGTGCAMSIAANRISYALNLRGPSIAVDTACSSALTAVHLACESLQQGECSLALVGGVNVLLKPDTFIVFAQASMLAKDGRCKAFDVSADGFGRGEGAGIVVLKPLSKALEDGDQIYASIRATAVNQDGRSSSMTVPSRDSQAALLREACRKAGVKPGQIQYVEAHGTGTQVGDPVEAGALGTVLREGRSDDSPCLIGSVKTNIGHLEAGAGIAGLMKLALALKHGQVPASLHFNEPSPNVPLEELGLRVPQRLESWPEHDGPALAGINSFGFGGANAHAILQGPPAREVAPRTPRTQRSDALQLVPVSARSGDALRALAGSYAEYLGAGGAGAELAFEDVCWTAARRRSHNDHRLCVVADGRDSLVEQLEAYAAGETTSQVVTGRRATGSTAASAPPRIAFVFSGQGPQWWGMGRQLLETEPLYRDVIERCDAVIRELGRWSLLDEFRRDESESRMQETSISQPAIFALQVGLAAVWKSWGIEPEAVVGHSVGEVAAAHLSGALDLEDAVRVIFHRGRCMDLASSRGKMLAVGLPFEEAAELVDGREELISLGAINSASSVTLSGDPATLEKIATQLEETDVFHRFLKVNYAFHSPMMDPVQDELLKSLAGIDPQECRIPMFSAVTGERAKGTELSVEYWWHNVRRTVCFGNAVQAMIEDGYDLFLELSPHPVLSGYVSETARGLDAKVGVAHSLRRGDDEAITLRKGLGTLFTRGVAIDWERVLPEGGRFVRLPTYAWQHDHYWSESEPSREARLGSDAHPLLGRRTRAGIPTWRKTLEGPAARYLHDHVVQGQALLAGASYLEMGAAAAGELFGPGPVVLENVQVAKACFLEDALTLQTTLDPAESMFTILSRPEGSDRWTEHVRGKVLSAAESPPTAAPVDLASIRSRCEIELSADECYPRLHALGLEYGPAFQGLEQVWCGDGEALGLIQAPVEIEDRLEGYTLQPALLDACLQTLIWALPQARAKGVEGSSLYLPVEFEQVRVYGPTPARFLSHAKLVSPDGSGVRADIRVFGEDGTPVADIRGIRCHSVGRGPAQRLDDLIYEYEWQHKHRPGQLDALSRSAGPPALHHIAEATRGYARDLETSFGRSAENERNWGILDALSRAFIWNAFQEGGVVLRPGDRISGDALLERLGAVPGHRRLVHRYLEILAEAGYLRRVGSEWEVERAYEGGDPRESRRELMARLPSLRPELTLIGRCGNNLLAVLRGEADPLELLFPDGSTEILEHMYQDSPFLRFDNMIAQRALSAACEALPDDRTVRILEVGAGTGALTSYLLPHLLRGRTEYVFTDLSSLFFSKAKEKFREYPFIEYKKLNLEEDPCEQDFEAHSFDIILAYHVLHATRDLRETLGNVGRLLRGDGLLVLTEPVERSPFTDLVFGLAEGWWRFTDTELRPKHPLLAVPQWCDLLEDCGFSEACDAGVDETARTTVILARGGAVSQSELSAPEAAAEEAATSGPASWLVLADRAGHGQALAELLRARGQHCVTVTPGKAYRRIGADQFEVAPERPEDIRRLLEELLDPDSAPCRGVVHLWNLDAPHPDRTSLESLEQTMLAGCCSVLSVARGLSEVEGAEVPRLWLVTSGAQSVGREPEATSPAQAASWGLNRVIANEAPRLRATAVDLGPGATPEELRSLCDELLLADDEDEIALRGDARYVHRLRRGATRDSGESRVVVGADVPAFRLESSSFGVLDKLGLRETEHPMPGPGEVVIRVAATGLNFSDVMKALGIYPGLPDGPVPLGLECSGTISAVGEGVGRFRPEDEVLAIAPFSFGSFVTTTADLAVAKPSQMGFEEAATIPIAFLTSYYALIHLAQLSKGERVLIQSAAGGVGLAAIQIAKRVGAEIFATAGSEEKRELLRSLGVDHVMDSRSLAFADEVVEITGGEGVDVVLNSLAGEAIRKGLEILNDFGRFLEIGKRDIYKNTRIGLLPFRKNISFWAIDLDSAMRSRTSFVASLFQELMEGFEEGAYSPLIYRVFPISNASGAFRHMAQAKHIGKVILSLQGQEVSVAPRATGEPRFRSDGTYLLTGGLGGFGLVVARWLVEHGARHLVLMGRSGASTLEAQQAVEELQAEGVEVVVARADVSKPDQVAGVLEQIEASTPPLRGVFHAAMVLADASYMNMDEEKMRTAWAPKVDGAWNLHAQTLKYDLDLFVLFSSMSSVIGGVGQSNYAAANSLLDSLAYYRRAMGLPGLSVSWSFIADVGFVARHDGLAQRFSLSGLDPLTSSEALALMGQLLQQKAPHVAAMRINLQRFRTGSAGVHNQARFSDLLSERDESAEAGEKKGAGAFRNALRAAAPEARPEMLQTWLRGQVANVLGASPEEVDVGTPLLEVGLDSLMAIELATWIEDDLHLSLSTMALVKGPSVVELATLVGEQFAKQQSGARTGQPEVTPPAPRARAPRPPAAPSGP